ncbi:MAG: hypothetical protein K2N43_08260 [Lachnospiraceae bacterium]|nr:hypothetical protein [Lachnospiraceae bacterium]
MAEFYEAVTTDVGLALSADLLTGEQIVFTKLVTGSGVYDEQDMTRPRLRKAWQIKEPRQQFEFSRIEKVTDNCILLKTLISNVNMTEGYRMTEIGVYAKKQGDEGDGILYSISVAKEPDFFPRYNGLAAIEIIEEYYITVSDAAEVLLQAGSGAAVLAEDLEKLKKELEALLGQKIEELQNKIDSTEDPFVQMTEETYIPPEKRAKGTLYGLITDKRGLVINYYDRYISGREDPAMDRTLYGVETTDRTTLELDDVPYAGICGSIAYIKESDVDRKEGILYIV